MNTVLILGATSDIAQAVARKFAQENYHLQLAARRPERLKNLASDLQIRHGIEVQTLYFDATKFEEQPWFFIKNLSPISFGSPSPYSVTWATRKKGSKSGRKLLALFKRIIRGPYLFLTLSPRISPTVNQERLSELVRWPGIGGGEATTCTEVPKPGYRNTYRVYATE